MKKKILILVSIVSLTGNLFSQSNYKLSDKIHLDGDGGWDYLIADDSTNRLFVSHGTMVQVIDTKEGKVIGKIEGMKGIHGIAFANSLNKGYISSGKDTMITVFDLTTYAVLKKIKSTGVNPDAILFDPFSKKVFVWNGRTSNATVIDATTDAIAGTITLPGKPEFSVTDGKGKIFVNIEDKSQLCQIDPVKMKVEQTWPVAPGDEPSGLAFDKETHRLFSVCDNKTMVILNSDNGKVITTLPIGDGVDGASFDPIRKRAYSSNGEGNITVVQEENENSFKVLETVPTQEGARTITINKKTGNLYLSTAGFGATPEATKENPHPHAALVPGSFVVLEVSPVK
jgi:DNA-binding beta-propeller fold protein YncE